ncbi:MAG: TetR/AcrR family transcriptional regulator [Solirubrobacterales bacterium]|jgi:AcrR family transcriptional regulator|nr:TetR/AcrR family transcriptional regulator [Solirubrobacterales bacterium]
MTPAARQDPRERLLEGMAASVRVQGFRGTTLADVVREARVSRRTFYEHFTDPVDCYIALLEQVAARTMGDIAAAIMGGGTPEERLDRAVGGYLAALEAEPLLMRSFLRELHLTGERGRRLLETVNERAGQTIHHLVEEARVREPDLGVHPVDVATARMIASGVVQMALMAQDDGRPLDEVRVTATRLLRRVIQAPEPDAAP